MEQERLALQHPVREETSSSIGMRGRNSFKAMARGEEIPKGMGWVNLQPKAVTTSLRQD